MTKLCHIRYFTNFKNNVPNGPFIESIEIIIIQNVHPFFLNGSVPLHFIFSTFMPGILIFS